MTRTTEPYALQKLAQGLSAVAGRLEPKEAAATLTQAMTRTTEPYALQKLAQGLSAVAGRLEPKEATAAAATLTQAMTRTTEPYALPALAQGLWAVTARIELKDAAAVCEQAAGTLIQALAKTTNPSVLGDLSEVLLHEDPSRLVRRRHGGTGAVGVLTCPGSVLIAPALLQSALEPLPPPLPAQTLVDLLKHPFCVGEARRLVLEQLTRHYQRSFADQWDFVRFAQEQELDLDLLTPPQRPGSPAAEQRPRPPAQPLTP
jgi:hypothetical protein